MPLETQQIAAKAAGAAAAEIAHTEPQTSGSLGNAVSLRKPSRTPDIHGIRCALCSGKVGPTYEEQRANTTTMLRKFHFLLGGVIPEGLMCDGRWRRKDPQDRQAKTQTCMASRLLHKKRCHFHAIAFTRTHTQAPPHACRHTPS